MKYLLAFFYFMHGIIHLGFVSPAPKQEPGAPEYPFTIAKSWLGLPEAFLKPTGTFLTVLVTIGFILVSMGILGFLVPQGWVKPVAIVSAIASLILVFIFWHNWFVAAPILNLIILYWFIFRV